METPQLTISEFWSSTANHIAVNPTRPQDAEGLEAFATSKLEAQGWCFFQTSGSEAVPKWVGLTKAAFVESARWVNGHFKLDASDHWGLALPLHHVGGFAIGARAMLTGACVSVFTNRWDAREFTTFCEVRGITVVSLVPAQVHDLVIGRQISPPCLRRVIVGGGGVSDALAAQACEFGWNVCRTYGMTEAASMIAAEADSSDVMMRVLPHWQVSVDDEDVLLIKGPSLAKGYALRTSDGSWCWEAIQPEAGLRTRDRVSLSAHGGHHYLAFLGRDSSFVKILGELVNLSVLQRHLEDALLQTQTHAGAVLVPLPDERRETRLALVHAKGEMTVEQQARLLAAYHSLCQPFEHVSEIIEVREIPRSNLGKVRMEALMAMVRK